MSFFALGILIYQMISAGSPIHYYLILVPILFLLVEAFVELPVLYDESGVNFLVVLWFLLPVVTVGFLIFSSFTDPDLWPLLWIPGMMAVAFVFYYYGIIYGGADAKAVVVLAILLPYYPVLHGITDHGASTQVIESMQSLFPFTFVVLLNSSVIMLVLPVSYLILNLKRGDLEFPLMFFGYRTGIDKARGSFVWPMEFYEGGERKVILRPRGDEEDMFDSLKGRKRIWVTPKIPFIVPMTIGFVISFLIGNPLMHLL